MFAVVNWKTNKSALNLEKARSAGSVKPRTGYNFCAVPFILPSHCSCCQNLVYLSQLGIKLSYFCLQLLHFLLHAIVMQDDALMLTQHSVMYGVHSVADQFATT
jgi:hypothetical protein